MHAWTGKREREGEGSSIYRIYRIGLFRSSCASSQSTNENPLSPLSTVIRQASPVKPRKQGGGRAIPRSDTFKINREKLATIGSSIGRDLFY